MKIPAIKKGKKENEENPSIKKMIEGIRKKIQALNY